MSKRHEKALLCFGEIGWDKLCLLNRLPRNEGDCHLLLEQEAPGGCALNTACVLQALGAPVSLGGNFVGEDVRGKAILEYLKKQGIDSRVRAREGLRTSHCQCLVEAESGRRNFILSYPDIQVFDPILLDTLVEETLSGKFTHVFAQAYIREACLAYLQQVQRTSAWILTQDLDPDSEFVPLCDAIQISLQDDQEFNPQNVDRLARPYFRGRLKQVFVTAGGRGAAACSPGATAVLVPGRRVKRVLDTTGCGDAFRAGLMAGLFRGLSLEEALELGQRAGAHKASLYGSHFTAAQVAGAL